MVVSVTSFTLNQSKLTSSEDRVSFTFSCLCMASCLRRRSWVRPPRRSKFFFLTQIHHIIDFLLAIKPPGHLGMSASSMWWLKSVWRFLKVGLARRLLASTKTSQYHLGRATTQLSNTIKVLVSFSVVGCTHKMVSKRYIFSCARFIGRAVPSYSSSVLTYVKAYHNVAIGMHNGFWKEVAFTVSTFCEAGLASDGAKPGFGKTK